MAYKKTLVLIDSSFPFEKLKQFDTVNNLFITFDYESHKKLSKEKIAHEISDKYLNIYDHLTITTEANRLSRWSNEPEPMNFLSYDDYNLGDLFYFELRYFLISFLKKFIEIKNIIANFDQVDFIASNDLYEITKSLAVNVEIGRAHV